ncbi:MAG: tRNA pseudouridine(55) synthase TruB [Spirochaetes bacterium]|nr:tRNA pseudouridine(55) synthase TruB [Spirochaetota bacterium]MBN2772360.1 tRNA pseudouridine(55) synthase TruB [Spirochaetota bacterium]
MNKTAFNDKVILIDKQKGLTSFDTISRLKKKVGIKKIGHSGTLDRLASGLLVVATGKATKLTRYFLDSDKTYNAVVQLGIVTDTLDADGTVVSSAGVTAEHMAGVSAVLDSFVGKIEQVPPLYSALKIDGKRVSDRVRDGEALTLGSRSVNVYSIDLISTDPVRSTFEMRVQCSKGTYIRSLARDIGQKLGCGASILELRRTASGEFSVEQAVSVENVSADADERNYIVTIESALKFMNQVTVDKSAVTRIMNGAWFDEGSLLSVDNRGSDYCAVSDGKMVLAIAKINFNDWHVVYENVFN